MTDGECLEAIRRLLRLADSYRLAELVVEESGIRITIRGGEGLAAGVAGVAAPEGALAEIRADPPRFPVIASPMTGVFYRSASLDAPPFVEEGDRVEEGQTLGLIEAMKVFSEIPADHSGRVVEILVASGTLVSQGDPLMLIDPEG